MLSNREGLNIENFKIWHKVKKSLNKRVKVQFTNNELSMQELRIKNF